MVNLIQLVQTRTLRAAEFGKMRGGQAIAEGGRGDKRLRTFVRSAVSVYVNINKCAAGHERAQSGLVCRQTQCPSRTDRSTGDKRRAVQELTTLNSKKASASCLLCPRMC